MSKKQSNSPPPPNRKPSPPPGPPSLDGQDDKVPFKTHNLICRDLDKAQARIKKIDDHFKDHYYLTRDDYEQIQREEYQAEVRRGMLENEGIDEIAIIDGIDFIDLP